MWRCFVASLKIFIGEVTFHVMGVGTLIKADVENP